MDDPVRRHVAITRTYRCLAADAAGRSSPTSDLAWSCGARGVPTCWWAYGDALQRALEDPLLVDGPLLANVFSAYHEAAVLCALDPSLADPGWDKRHADLVLRANTYLAGDVYPRVLHRLDDADLVALVRRFGQDPGLDVRASNAPSWEYCDERMGYITCFFRCFQREPCYFGQPPA
jgi:hypothetical protein